MKTDKIAHFQIKVKPIFSYCQMHAEHPLPRNRPNAFLIEAKAGVLGLRKTCHTVTFSMVQEEVKTKVMMVSKISHFVITEWASESWAVFQLY